MVRRSILLFPLLTRLLNKSSHCLQQIGNFPLLKGVTEVPLVKPDGTLLDTPGYDKKLKIFYDPSEDLKNLEIPEYCTQDDAINAAKVLQYVIAEFPF